MRDAAGTTIYEVDGVLSPAVDPFWGWCHAEAGAARSLRGGSARARIPGPSRGADGGGQRDQFDGCNSTTAGLVTTAHHAHPAHESSDSTPISPPPGAKALCY